MSWQGNQQGLKYVYVTLPCMLPSQTLQYHLYQVFIVISYLFPTSAASFSFHHLCGQNPSGRHCGINLYLFFEEIICKVYDYG